MEQPLDAGPQGNGCARTGNETREQSGERDGQLATSVRARPTTDGESGVGGMTARE